MVYLQGLSSLRFNRFFGLERSCCIICILVARFFSPCYMSFPAELLVHLTPTRGVERASFLK